MRMFRNVLAATAVAVMAGSALGADYQFPSSTPPGNVDPSTIPQYIMFMWDDNGYSGEKGTMYETRALKSDETSLPQDEFGRVDGVGPDWVSKPDTYGHLLKSEDGEKQAYKNPLDLKEGDLGISWAVKTFGAKMQGKGKGHMTFNMISGLFIPAWGVALVEEEYDSWKNRVSEYGGTKDDFSEHESIAISWGREQRLSTSPHSTPLFDGAAGRAYMEEGMAKLIAAGHEIGNHTVDHIETNSIWPKDLWPNGGDGFDSEGTADILGGAWDESGAGYSDSVCSRGWMKYAGKALEKKTWDDILRLGEQDGVKYVDNYPSKLYGFRAPRLEINSNMFYALSERDYLYDCGVEEGTDEHFDGTNFLWPYTTDNGVPDFSRQASLGYNISVDSLPAGLWEIPVNLFIVPDNIQDAVIAGHNEIRKAEGDEPISVDSWNGKITGFDFNLFVRWAVNKDQAVSILNHTLDLHYDGNRAPMQIGGHTDYFSPMYDNATLDKPTEAYRMALPKHNPVDGAGNTWLDRKAAFMEFITHANSKSDVEYVSGKELIDAIKAMGSETVGSAKLLPNDQKWDFVSDGQSADKTDGDIEGNAFLLSALMGTSNPTASFTTVVDKGDMDGLTHISMEYRANSAFAIILTDDQDTEWEVLINNKNNNVKSGDIPLSAFRNTSATTWSGNTLEANTIEAISIAPRIANGQVASVNISEFTLHGASITAGSKDSRPDDSNVDPIEVDNDGNNGNNGDDGDDIGGGVEYTGTWEFETSGTVSKDEAGAENFDSDNWDGDITITAPTSDSKDDSKDYWEWSGVEYPSVTYVSWGDAGFLDGMTDLAFSYTSSHKVQVQIYVEGDETSDGNQAVWSFMLPKSSSEKTKKIAISQFVYDEYSSGTEDEIDVSKINGIGFSSQFDYDNVPDSKDPADQSATLSINDLVSFGTTASPILDGNRGFNTASAISFQGIRNGDMQLNIATSGVYSVKLFSANGRMIHSVENANLTSGLNDVGLGHISTGLYFVEVRGVNQVMKTKALVH